MQLGIDPGLSGAFAVYDVNHNNVVVACNVPTLTIARNNKSKRSVDILATLRMLHGFAAKYLGLSAHMEQVGAMPGQGVSSMFSFGRTDGIIETAVVSAGIPLSKVPPARWKLQLGCGKDKDATILRANQLIPASVEFWTPTRGVRTKDECYGTAEAALIAYYGAKFGVDRSLVAT